MPVKTENPSGWPKRWFGEFFLSFSLKAHNYYPAYHIGPDFLTKKSRYDGILFMKTFYNVVNANLLCIGSACFDRPRYWWKKSMFKRLVYTPPDLSPRFPCKVNLSKTKNPAWFFIQASLLDRGMERVHWLPPRTIVWFIKLYFGAVQLSIVSQTKLSERLWIKLIKLRWWAPGLFCLGIGQFG